MKRHKKLHKGAKVGEEMAASSAVSDEFEDEEMGVLKPASESNHSSDELPVFTDLAKHMASPWEFLAYEPSDELEEAV